MKDNAIRFYLVTENFSSELWPQIEKFIRMIDSNHPSANPHSSSFSDKDLFKIYIDSKPTKQISEFRKLEFSKSLRQITFEYLGRNNIRSAEYYYCDFVVIIKLRDTYINFKEYLGFFVLLDNFPNISLGIDINKIDDIKYQNELCFSLGQLFANWKYKPRFYKNEIVADHTIFCIWESALYDNNTRKITHGAFPTVKKPFNDLRKFSPIIEIDSDYFNLLFGKSLRDLEEYFNLPQLHESLYDNAHKLNEYYSNYLFGKSSVSKQNDTKIKHNDKNSISDLASKYKLIEEKLNKKSPIRLINFQDNILFPDEYEYLLPVNQPLQPNSNKFIINIINVFIVRYLYFFSSISIDGSKTNLIKKYFASEPLISIYIFCLLLDRYLQSHPGAKSKGKAYKEYINKIDSQVFINFIDFSLTFSNSIKEIVQNIIHHTPNKKGYLYFVLWEDKDFVKMTKDEVESLLKSNKYLDGYFNLFKSSYYLDISIFDSNNKGIVNTYNDMYKVVIDFPKFFFGKYSDFATNSHLDLRYLAHLGLKVFSKIIDFRNGMFIVETSFFDRKEQLIFSPQFRKFFDSGIKHEILHNNYLNGTFYNFVLPIDTSLFKISEGFTTTIESDTFIDSFSSFISSDYSVLNINSEVISAIPHTIKSGAKERQNFVTNFCENLIESQTEIKSNQLAIALNFNDMYSQVNDLGLIIKILAYLKLSEHFRYIIIYNIEEQYLHDFVVTLSVLKDFNLFWSNNHQMYIYNEEMIPLIVSGSSIDEFISINKLVKKYYGNSQINIINKLFNNSHQNVDTKSIVTPQPLELFVETSNDEIKLSLFEKYVYSLLNSDNEKSNPFSLRMKNAHMRLGSKIHIDNFYDAVVLFQDSFFVDRFAFLISREILNNYDRSRQIILIGYGDYSEMLLDRMQTILNSAVRLENHEQCTIGYIILKDISDLSFVHFEFDVQFDKYFYAILVPISSTLTTNYKIKKAFEDEVNKITSKSKINFELTKENLIYNATILMVRDDFLNSNGLTAKEQEYYWESIDNYKKVVNTKYFPDRGINFFISLNGNWALPLTCQKCFPSVDSFEKSVFANYSLEQPLMETNKASVIPINILSWPIVNADKSTSSINIERILLLKNSVWYGHFERNLNHHLFYIDTLSFMQTKSNVESIKIWLDSLKEYRVFNCPDTFNIIVTITHNTNMNFVNLVNDKIFNGSATILRLDISTEFRNNIIEKYTVLNSIDSNINFHFVDDAISTGRTISLAKSYISSIFPFSKTNISVFSSIITIINRSSMFSQNDILQFQRNNSNDLENFACFFPFINLFVPVLRDPKSFCFICSAKEEYEKLASSSQLSIIQNGYLKKAFKLKIKSAEGNHESHINKFNRMLLVHKLYEDLSLSDDKLIILESLWNSQNNLPDKIDIIKILTTPLFSYYKNIKDSILPLLLSEMNNFLSDNLPDSLSFYSLNHLLIMMKQLLKLKSNFIIRKYNIERIWNFYHSYYHKYEFLTSLDNSNYKKNLFHLLHEVKILKEELREYEKTTKEGFVSAIEKTEHEKELSVRIFEIKGIFNNRISYKEMDLLILESCSLNDEIIFNKAIDNFLNFYVLFAMMVKESVSDDLSTSFWFEFMLRTGDELKDSSNVSFDKHPFIHHHSLYELKDLDITPDDPVRMLFRKFYNIILIENTSILQQAFNSFNKEVFHQNILEKLKQGSHLNEMTSDFTNFKSKILTEYYYDYFGRFIGAEIMIEEIYNIYLLKNYLHILESGILGYSIEEILKEIALHFSKFMQADAVFFSFKDIINKNNLYTIGRYNVDEKVPFEINDEFYTHKCILDSFDYDNYWFEFFSPYPLPEGYEEKKYKEYSKCGAEHLIVIRIFESIFGYNEKLPEHLGGITFIYKSHKSPIEWANLKLRIRVLFLLKNELISFLEHNFKNYNFANYIQKQLDLSSTKELLKISRHTIEHFPDLLVKNLFDPIKKEPRVSNPLIIYNLSKLISSNVWFGNVSLYIRSNQNINDYIGASLNNIVNIQEHIQTRYSFIKELVENSSVYFGIGQPKSNFRLINFTDNSTKMFLGVNEDAVESILYEIITNAITHSNKNSFTVEIEVKHFPLKNLLIFRNYPVFNKSRVQKTIELLNKRKYSKNSSLDEFINQGIFNINFIFDNVLPKVELNFNYDPNKSAFELILEFLHDQNNIN